MDPAMLVGVKPARSGRRRSALRRRSAARPCRSQISRKPRRNAGGTTLTPPSPWIGSIMIAPVPGPIAASTAARSVSGIWSKPSTLGPKPSRYLAWPPAAIIASVRPWNAPSKVKRAIALGTAVDRMAPARHLHRRLVGLGARIGEEHEIGEGRVDETAGKALALGILIEVRDVPELRALAGQSFDEVRMGVADRGHGDAGAEIEIALARPSTRASSPRRARKRHSPGRKSGPLQMSRGRCPPVQLLVQARDSGFPRSARARRKIKTPPRWDGRRMGLKYSGRPSNWSNRFHDSGRGSAPFQALGRATGSPKP